MSEIVRSRAQILKRDARRYGQVLQEALEVFNRPNRTHRGRRIRTFTYYDGKNGKPELVTFHRLNSANLFIKGDPDSNVSRDIVIDLTHPPQTGEVPPLAGAIMGLFLDLDGENPSKYEWPTTDGKTPGEKTPPFSYFINDDGTSFVYFINDDGTSFVLRG